MQLVSPDILADARGLSLPLCVTGLVVGLALWLLGWWGHRFWVVMLATVVGGLCGLTEGPAFRAQPLVAALLLAFAAGLLALALVRLAAFAAGGFALLAAVQPLGPAPDHALILFLIGGIVGVVLFRPSLMALTSVSGTLLAVHSALCLADGLGRLDASAWADSHATLLNWLCGGMALLGLALQLLLHRLRSGASGKGRPKGADVDDLDEIPQAFPKKLKPWRGKLFRKAG